MQAHQWKDYFRCNRNCQSINIFLVGPNGYTANTQDIYNLEAGNYTVNVTDANGNVTTETIVVNEPSPLININHRNTLTCTLQGNFI